MEKHQAEKEGKFLKIICKFFLPYKQIFTIIAKKFKIIFSPCMLLFLNYFKLFQASY